MSSCPFSRTCFYSSLDVADEYITFNLLMIDTFENNSRIAMTDFGKASEHPSECHRFEDTYVASQSQILPGSRRQSTGSDHQRVGRIIHPANQKLNSY